MDKSEQIIQQGFEAEALTSNPAFRQALASLKQGVHDRWAQTPIRDLEGQHELRLMLKLCADFEGNLLEAINNGKFVAADLKIKRSATDAIRKAAKAL